MAAKFQSYPGTRDFYPTEMQFRTWMFEVQRRICHRFGYGEYQAPIIESTDLYRSKSSEEIVNEQLYTFTDRGNREVSIRPEMTPTLARMAVDRPQSETMPLRWFSIANFMRYERPGKGRLREFYQLNVDLLGASGPAADAEILMIAIDLMKEYGATDDMFVVRVSDRRLLDLWIGISDTEKLRRIGRLIDKKEKITEEVFNSELVKECEDSALEAKVKSFLALQNQSLDQDLHQLVSTLNLTTDQQTELVAVFQNLKQVRSLLSKVDADSSVLFDPSIVRGFDYYTGLVFEIYDTNPENRRAIFGGGRYDRLLAQFGGKQEIAAIGFGMGDVTLEHFLEGHNLKKAQSTGPKAYLALLDSTLTADVQQLAFELRNHGISIEVSLETTKKFGKQIELAQKKGYRYLLILGEDELKAGTVILKDLETGAQSAIKRNLISKSLID